MSSLADQRPNSLTDSESSASVSLRMQASLIKLSTVVKFRNNQDLHKTLGGVLCEIRSNLLNIKECEPISLETEGTCSEKLNKSSIVKPKFHAVLIGVNEDKRSRILILCGIAGLAGNTSSSVF